MLQPTNRTNPLFAGEALSQAAPVSVDAPPSHVDTLLWQLASPSEREQMRDLVTPGMPPSAAPEEGALAASGLPMLPNAALWRNAVQSPSAGRAGADQALADQAASRFRDRFKEAARNPEAFGELLRKSFGDRYDAQAAEGLRQQALRGDDSWMPKIQVVGERELADVSGKQAGGTPRAAYAQASDTVYLSRELLRADADQAERALSEEMGHAIDARINRQDAAGDEGEIFSAALHGERLDDAQLNAMRAENDRGVIRVGGQEVEVEYSLGKKLKKGLKNIGKAVEKVGKSVGNFVEGTAKAVGKVAEGVVTLDADKVKEGLRKGVDTVKEVAHDAKDMLKSAAKAVKTGFKQVMESELLGKVLAVARFIPIPIVQAVVRVIDMAKAGYAVYQGVKHKSLGAVLGGVAGLAGGGANFAGALGASQSIVNGLKNVATAARTAGTVHNALANKSWADVAGLAANAFGAPKGVTGAIKTAAQVQNLAQAVDRRDYAGALSGATALAKGHGAPKAAVNGLESLRDTAATVDRIRTLAAKHPLQAVQQLGHAVGAPQALMQEARRLEQGIDAVQQQARAQAAAWWRPLD